jgi:hypothetical protein
MGLAVSPVAAGLIGSAGLRIVFMADVVLLLVIGILVRHRLRTRPSEPLERLEPVEP